MRLPGMLLAAIPLAFVLYGEGAGCTRRVAGTDLLFARGASPEERYDKTLAMVRAEALSADAARLLGEVKTGIAVDLPDKLEGLPAGTSTLALLDEETRPLLFGTDEQAAAAALRAKGVRAVVVHSDIRPGLDRNRTVLSRLYNHDQLSLFSLVRVTDGLLIYQLIDRPLQFTPQIAALSVAYLRHRLAGNAPPPFPDLKSEVGHWAMMAVLRHKDGGREMAVALARNGKLQLALEELVGDLEMHHRRRVELMGFPPLSQGMDDIRIEVHRIVERAYVEPREEEVLEDLWEMGIDGAYIMTADKKERGSLPGAAAYTRAIRTADEFLRTAADMGRMSENRPWRDPAAWLEILRTIHFMEIPGQGITPLYRGFPVIPLEAVSLPVVRQSILASGNWYLANLTPKGQVTYKFWPSENRYSDEYNHVRHELATWNLVQAWNLDPRPEYLEGAKKALEWTNASLVREGDMAFYDYDNNRKLGSAVVALLGLVDLAIATGDHQWDELMKELGRFTKFMQLENGKFNGYYVPKGHPYYEMENDIVPGEAALALVRLAEYFDDDTWIEGIPRYFDYYIPWFRERAERVDRQAPWPAYTYSNEHRLDLVEFGPWTVMAANAYHRRTGDERAAKFGLEIAHWMIDSYQWDSERAPFPDYIGGYYKFAGELPAMQAFCYGEGTAAAYQLALRYAKDEARYFERHTRETVRFALNMQYNELSIYPFTRGREVLGGTRYAMNETKVRVDYVYHAQSALVQWYEAAKSDPDLPEAVRSGFEALAQSPTEGPPGTGPLAGAAPGSAAAAAGLTPPFELPDGGAPLSVRPPEPAPLLPFGIGGRPAEMGARPTDSDGVE